MNSTRLKYCIPILVCAATVLQGMDERGLEKEVELHIRSGKDFFIGPKELEKTITVMAFHDNKNHVITGAMTGDMQVWDMSRKGKQIRTCKAHEDFIVRLTFSPDRRLLFSVSNYGKIRMWNTEKGYREMQSFCDPESGLVFKFGFVPKTDDLILGCLGNLSYWKMQNGKYVCERTIDRSVDTDPKRDLPTLPTSDIVFNGDKNHMISGSKDSGILDGTLGVRRPIERTLTVWDIANKFVKKCVLKGHTSKIDYLFFNDSDNHLMSLSRDKALRIWDGNLDNYPCIKTLQSYPEVTRTISFH